MTGTSLTAALLVAALGPSAQRAPPTVGLPAAELEAVAAKVRPTVVMLHTRDLLGTRMWVGTGFFISADGRLVTNHHVMEDASEMVAVDATGALHRVSGVFIVDEANDLAILKVDGDGHAFLPLGTTAGLAEGRAVGVYGAPLGLGWTLSHGTVSGIDLSPDPSRQDSAFRKEKDLRISATMVGKGNSGSPVFDMSGAVIGVVHSGVGESGGIAFAAPVEAVARLLRHAPPEPKGFDQERAARRLSARSRNLLVTLGLACLAGAFFGVRALRRRRLRRKLERLAAELALATAAEAQSTEAAPAPGRFIH